jgi:putative transposase
VSDLTYVSILQGFVYVADFIDMVANKIVGWRTSGSRQSPFVFDTLEPALYRRRPAAA